MSCKLVSRSQHVRNAVIRPKPSVLGRVLGLTCVDKRCICEDLLSCRFFPVRMYRSPRLLMIVSRMGLLHLGWVHVQMQWRVCFTGAWSEARGDFWQVKIWRVGPTERPYQNVHMISILLPITSNTPTYKSDCYMLSGLMSPAGKQHVPMFSPRHQSP